MDADGRLVACERWNGALARMSRTERQVLAERAPDGQPLNAPNDLTIRSDGNIYFSDTTWGSRLGVHAPTAVYRLAPDGARRWRSGSTCRNGVVLSPDGSTLYVGSDAQIVSGDCQWRGTEAWAVPNRSAWSKTIRKPHCTCPTVFASTIRGPSLRGQQQHRGERHRGSRQCRPFRRAHRLPGAAFQLHLWWRRSPHALRDHTACSVRSAHADARIAVAVPAHTHYTSGAKHFEELGYDGLAPQYKSSPLGGVPNWGRPLGQAAARRWRSTGDAPRGTSINGRAARVHDGLDRRLASEARRRGSERLLTPPRSHSCRPLARLAHAGFQFAV